MASPALTELVINDATNAGDLTVAAAVAGKKTRVYQLYLQAAGAVVVELLSGATSLSGPITLATGVPVVLPYTGVPWFTGGTNEAITLTTSADVQVSGRIFTRTDMALA